tara:strand:+ start:193 stop:687 length:495 start_codon:yes stop_codon:yes gene_type:complete
MIAEAHLIIALVSIQRIIELIIANKNTKTLLNDGAIEYGSRHYPLFIILHSTWLLSIAILTPIDTSVNYVLLSVFVLLQIGRIWIISSLGKFWTTRIIRLHNVPLIQKGPYRWIKHPNYIIVSFEILILPLVFNQLILALLFSILNFLLLYWRIKIENMALNKL